MSDLAGRSIHERIDHDLTNHAPATPAVIVAFETIRAEAKGLAHLIADQCPPGREQSLALTNLEQTVMWAVAAIARNQDRLPE
ncbi:MAG: hypothetical protein ACLGIO_14255 [Acidimicrobiia bacterium]